ncbi:MAG: TetR/AcrR family transcriptional regulator [Pseudomonadota bacterium]
MTKRERAAAQRRQLILEAAMTCFLEHGYHQSGVRDIAKQAGISLGNLYNHFPGKHDVLVEIAALERAGLEPVLKLLQREDEPPTLLEAFIQSYGQLIAEPDSLLLTIEITSEAVRKPDIGALFLGNRDELVRALQGLIDRGIERGDFRRTSDSLETAHFIVELIDACAYRSVLSEVDMTKQLSHLREFVFASLQRSKEGKSMEKKGDL